MSQDQDRQVRRKVTDFFRQAPVRYLVFSAVLGIIILILIIWFLPYWQVPVSRLSLKDRLHQINENRRTLAQLMGGIAGGFLALIGLYIAWVRSKAMKDQAEVAREQQLTDLYVKAVEQLGSEKLQIRLGGIYALERIARESAKDHWTVMEVLTAFVRENAPRRETEPIIETRKEFVTIDDLFFFRPQRIPLRTYRLSSLFLVDGPAPTAMEKRSPLICGIPTWPE